MQPITSDSGNSVAIDRLHCRYFFPRGHPSPERLSSDLDRIVRTSLADSCARELDQALDPSDPSVWVIRSLEFTLALDSGFAREDQIGAAWGAHFANAIVRIIRRGPDGETVLRFADRARYLAAFLRDLVRGRAFELWQYRSLAWLRSLPVSAAARQALIREPQLIPAILATLHAQQSLEGLLTSLSEPDILRVVESASVSGASGDGERQCAQSLLDVWRTAGLRPAGDTYVTPQNLVRLLVRAANDRAWTERLVTVAGHLLALCHFLRRTDKPRPLLLSLAAGDVRRAAEEAASHGDSRYLESLPFLRDLAGGDASWLAAAFETMADRAAPPEDQNEQGATYFTPFGGLLLLLPTIAGSGTLDLLSHSGVDLASGVLTLLMKCAGGSLAVGVFDDPLYRRLAGVSPRLSARELADSLPPLEAAAEPDDSHLSFQGTPFALDPRIDRSWSAAAAAILRRFASRFAGFEHSSPQRLYQNFLDAAASVSITGAGVEARLARPPLAILLQMSGYDSVALRLPWLNETEVTVTLAET